MPGGARPLATFVEQTRSSTSIVYRSSRAVWFWLLLGPALGAIVVLKLAVERGPLLPTVPILGSFSLFWMLVIWTNAVIRARLVLDLGEARVHYWERLWTGRVARWSLSKADVAHVSLKIDPRGVAIIGVARREAAMLVIDQGADVDHVQRLAADLARCWGVPLRT